MTSEDLLNLLMVIPLWLVVAFRTYVRNGRSEPNPGQDALLFTFATLALAATLRVPSVVHALADATGVRDIAILPRHLAVMASCLLLVGWVDSATPPHNPKPWWRRLAGPRPRLIFGVITAGAAIVTFGGAAPVPLAANGDVDFTAGQYGDTDGTVYLLLYLVPIGVALALSAALCHAAATRAAPGAYRICMRLMAAGCVIGGSYPLFRITYLTYGLTGSEFPLTAAEFDLVGTLIPLATILPVIAGSSIRGFDVVGRARRNRRALIRLRPLWADLVFVLSPDKIRDYLANGTSPAHDRWRLRGAYNRLDARVVDISDAAFELLPWIDEDLPARALAVARAHGLTADDANAAATALCLRVARRRAVDGEPPACPSTVEPLLELRDDQEANAQWLTSVSTYYAFEWLDGLEKELTEEKVPA
ncbi:MAB_1171c family putative transporter [Streptomyces boncukensis]|uniref:DUF6545 domain-containing protein n=1 Tax=Streptomyces boncukensis TaxID=2711219 RepID=A0A6G4WP06_9ACTN|nr:MAB_1171c family putative transporter [Streptomyces boncukensis]NGO66996.1 hypothetical protein [Streptomyces boncukensis]